MGARPNGYRVSAARTFAVLAGIAAAMHIPPMNKKMYGSAYGTSERKTFSPKLAEKTLVNG